MNTPRNSTIERQMDGELKMAEKTNWQAQELDIAISNLAANLLRIMAGAGRTVDLERQLKETNNLAKEVYAQSPVISESIFNEALELRWPHVEVKTDDDRDFNEEKHAIASIVRYSLRIAAAKITGNNSEASKAESDLHNSLRHYENGRRERLGQRRKPDEPLQAKKGPRPRWVGGRAKVKGPGEGTL
jgi:hypothetical protein